MSASVEDYCDLCDLPRSQCPHGRPPTPVAEPAPVPKAAPRRAVRTTRVPGAPAKRVQRRWTPADALEPHILAVLQAAGGELETDDVMLELEIRLEDRLLPGDQEKTPEGELRWRYAARKARQSLARQGLMATGRPGVWQLTDAGLRSAPLPPTP